MKTKKNAYACGSATVEATLVMAIVLAIVFSVIVYGMILHDRVVLKEMSNYYAEALMHMLEEPVAFTGELEINRLEEESILKTRGYGRKELEEEVEVRFFTGARTLLLLTELRSVTVTLSARQASIAYETSLRSVVGDTFFRLISSEESGSGVTVKDRRTDPEEFIRLLRGIVWRKKDNGDQNGTSGETDDGTGAE